MSRVFKQVCVLMLSVMLLFTMTPMTAISLNAPDSSQQTQSQTKEQTQKKEDQKSETEKKETEESSSSESGENKDSGNATSETEKETGSTTEAETKASEADKSTKKEETTKKEEEKYPAQTLTANAGGVKVTLKAPKGSLPEDSKLKAKQVGQKYINAVDKKLEAEGRELTDAVAIDVTPVDKSGKEIQPKKSVTVTFSGTGLDLESGDSVDVYRVSDDASSVIDVNGSGTANNQTFKTNHFTIYVAGGSATNPNGDGSGANTSSNPYKLAYGASIVIIDDDSSSSSDTWRIADGNDYLNLTTGSDFATRATVTNINGGAGATEQIVHITHGRKANRHYYIKALPEITTHSVTYDPKGGKIDGSTNPKTITVDDGSTIQILAAPTDKANYTFDCWKAGGTEYQPGTDYTVRGDVTFEAQWKPDSYSIAYDYAEGEAPQTANPDAYTVEDNVRITNEPTRKGYTFKGWTGSGITEPQKTISWDAGSQTGNKSYTANWEIVEYSIAYDYDGGTAPTTDNPTKYTVNSNVKIENEPTKTGYTFEGWTGSGIDEPKKTISWEPGQETGNKSYKANWKADEYDISYDYDGGKAPAEANPGNYTIESEINITNKPTREGYNFTGWTGSGIDDPQMTISWEAGSKTGDKSYKANWEIIEYTIDYDYDGGTAPETANPTKYTIATDNVKIENEPTKKGYNFKGWTGDGIDEPQKTISWSAGEETGNKEYKANWEAVKYSINYEYAGGDEPEEPNPSEYTVEDPVSISKEPTRKGYVFTGWTGNGIDEPTKPVEWSAGEQTGNKKYTANWKLADYKITYDYDGGTAPSEANPSGYTYEEDVDISHDPTKKGYTFKGWTGDGIDEPQKTISWKAGDETGDKEYKANWEAINYTITYEYAGGVKPSEDNPSEYTVEDPVNISKEPTRTGYTFTGWTGSGIDEPKKTIRWKGGDEAENKEYTANWELTEYTISYDLDGGDEPSTANPETYKYDQDITIENEPEKVGYTFEGWTGSGIDQPQKTISWNAGEETGDKSYKANWKPIVYRITYNYAGGEEPETPNPKTYTVEDEVNISNKPTREGYVFVGWTSFDTHPHIDEPENPVGWSAGEQMGDLTFNAWWKKQYTLKYHTNSGDDQATIYPPGETLVLTLGEKIDLATATYGGHNFVGWNTDQGGQGQSYAGGSEFTMPDHDVDLWAQWEQHPISITYHYNYENANEPFYVDSAQEKDDYYEIISDIPEREGYLFVGWSTKRADFDDIYFPEGYFKTGTTDDDLYAIWAPQSTEVKQYYNILTGIGDEVYYTGQVQKVTPKHVEADIGGDAWIGVTSTDEPKTHGDYKYAGYVRVGDKDDSGSSYHHLYALVRVDSGLEIKGKEVGVYSGPRTAPLYTHRDGTQLEGMEPLNQYIEITKSQLKIKAIPIQITTDSAKRAHEQGNPLTAGGTVTVGAADDKQNFPDGPETYNIEPGEKVAITLVGGEQVIIEITGSREAVGSSRNTVDVHWSDEGTTANQHNYTVSKNLGTLTVYDFTVEFDKNTEDPVEYMPDNWEGDAPGRKIILSSKVPRRAHSQFLGWATSSGGEPEYQPGDEYTYPENVTDVKFYAKWSAEVDVVTYDPNGGKFDGKTRPTEIPCTYGEEHTIREAATRNYYNFVEWNTKKDGTGTKYNPGGTYTVEGDVTFYAQWTPKTYTISYNYNGGVAPSEDNPTEYTVEDPVSITHEPTRENYTFIGWTGGGIDEPTTPVEWEPGDMNGNKTFKANWTPIEYKITYDYADGQKPEQDNPSSYTVEDPVSIANEPTRDGYDFVGWTGGGIDEPTTPVDWSPGDELGNKEFTANWKVIEYKITYDYADGQKPEQDNPSSYTVEDPVSIANEPTRDGYDFVGWTGGGIDEPTTPVEWSPGDELGEKTFTANWTPVEYKISYDYAGGEAPATANPDKYTIEDDVEIDNRPTREGYDFDGWTGSGIDDPAETIEWSKGDEIGDKSYKANWTAKDMQITYDANGGKVKGKDSITEVHKYDDNIKITEAATSDEGLIFKGWQEINGETYQPGDQYTVKKTTTFIAQWKMPINYDPTGGKLDGKTTPTVKEYDPGSTFLITGKPTKDRYTFKGWNTKKDGSGDMFQPGDTCEASSAMAFYAIWEEQPKVIYIPNGGVFRGKTNPTTIWYDYDEEITIAEEPTREGYTFLYWEGSKYYPGDTYKVVDPVHLFVAQWEKNDEPAGPDDPDKPDLPDKPEKKAKKAKKKATQTGDETMLGTMVAAMGLAGALAILIRRRRRHE